MVSVGVARGRPEGGRSPVRTRQILRPTHVSGKGHVAARRVAVWLRNGALGWHRLLSTPRSQCHAPCLTGECCGGAAIADVATTEMQ